MTTTPRDAVVTYRYAGVQVWQEHPLPLANTVAAELRRSIGAYDVQVWVRL